MTVNHDVVGSSPTGGVVNVLRNVFYFIYINLIFLYHFSDLFLLIFFVLSSFS